jgi:hypothetical protein
VHFEIHDDSTVVNLDGDECSWFLGFLDVAEAALPDKFYLADNYPNPFNPSTTVRFGLTREQMVRAEVFNLRGQRVACCWTGPCPPDTTTWCGTRDRHRRACTCWCCPPRRV